MWDTGPPEKQKVDISHIKGNSGEVLLLSTLIKYTQNLGKDKKRIFRHIGMRIFLKNTKIVRMLS